MPAKNTTRNKRPHIKVKDLKPQKDAKGGGFKIEIITSVANPKPGEKKLP